MTNCTIALDYQAPHRRWLTVKRARALLQGAIGATLRSERIRGSIEVSVVLVDETVMRKLNRRHRRRSYATDVLAFPQFDGAPHLRAAIRNHQSAIALGDLVISLDAVAAQAREFGWSRDDELALLAVHGTLHLLGYVDEDDASRARMERRQEEVMVKRRRNDE